MAVSTEQKVGIFFLMALIALAVMIELVEDWKPFSTRHEYHTYFRSAVGIQAGDPVRLAGVEVGKVTRIDLADDRVRVDFHVSEKAGIREDTVARIRQSNLLGGQFLGLTFGSDSSMLVPPGSTIQSREGTNIDQLISSFDQNQERVLGALAELIDETRGPLSDTVLRLNRVVARMEQGEGTLGRLINDPAVYDELKGSLDNLNHLLAGIRKGEGSLGRLVNDPALYEEAHRTLANLRHLSDQVREGEGTVGRLFTENELYVDAADALGNIRDIAKKANEGEGSLGRLVNDEALYVEAHGTMARLHSITAKIDDGEGTLGKLVNEDDIYRDARTTLHKVEKAADGVRDSGPISALGVVLGTMF